VNINYLKKLRKRYSWKWTEKGKGWCATGYWEILDHKEENVWIWGTARAFISATLDYRASKRYDERVSKRARRLEYKSLQTKMQLPFKKDYFFSILFLILMFATTSCGETSEVRTNELKTSSSFYDRQVEIITFEGHEYIHIDYGSASWGSHSGSCKHPSHQCHCK
jgi:hypothetical protein